MRSLPTNLLMILAVILMLVSTPLTVALGQVVPEKTSALMVGPLFSEGGVAFKVGLAEHVAGPIWVAGFGEFGETVEAEGEMIALFEIMNGVYVGPVAAIGVDWSSEPGTDGLSAASYLFGATGLASTLAATESLGAWGFYKYQFSGEDTFYINKWTAGVGIYLRI